MKHYVSFDIDQTLIDTHALNTEAYRRLGVEMPSYAVGLRWQDWLYNAVGSRDKADEIHTRKVYLYMDMLRDHKNIRSLELPPAAVARELLTKTNINVRFVTAGSMSTANVILQRLGLRAPLTSNVSYEARRLMLHTTVLSCDGVAAYIDDREDTITKLRDDVPGLVGVHFTGQTSDELHEQLRGAIRGRS